jgi:hypothetical protein
MRKRVHLLVLRPRQPTRAPSPNSVQRVCDECDETTRIGTSQSLVFNDRLYVSGKKGRGGEKTRYRRKGDIAKSHGEDPREGEKECVLAKKTLLPCWLLLCTHYNDLISKRQNFGGGEDGDGVELTNTGVDARGGSGLTKGK